MKIELPKFTRCCFCIPLRYGLLVWGYIKLVITLVVFLFGALMLQMYMQLIFIVGFGVWPIILIGMSMLLFLMIDIGMSIVFLIGGHRKTIRLLKIFYIYSIVLLCVVAALLFISTIYDLSVGDDYNNRYRQSSYYRQQYMSYGAMVTTKVVVGIAFLGIQAYIVLIIRSEISKLMGSRNFRFHNNAIEAECAMFNAINGPELATPVLNDADVTEDPEIGSDDKKTIKKINETNTNEGTFNYGKL